MTKVTLPVTEIEYVVGQPKKKALTKTECSRIHREAWSAANKAAWACKPAPMIVGTPDAEGQIDVNKKVYYVSSGVCGFAWVEIHPARGAFVNYLKAKGIGAKSDYYGGWHIRSNMRNLFNDPRVQSMEIAEAWAYTYASVLQKYGIPARGNSRMD
jgi:hypothetical protein